MSGSDTGFLVLNDKGLKGGGGMLLFNTSVEINNSRIENCTATHGGGMYIRNSPRFKQESLPGPRLTEVSVSRMCGEGSEGFRWRRGHGEELLSGIPGMPLRGKLREGGVRLWGRRVHGRRFARIIRDVHVAEPGRGRRRRLRHQTSNIGDEHRSGVVIRERSLLEGNTAHGGGGGCYGYDSRFALINTTFRNNLTETYLYPNNKRQAAGGGAFLRYDGAYKSTIPCLLDDCVFESDQADAPQSIPESSEDSFVGGALVLSTETRIKLLIKSLICKNNMARRGKHLALPDSSLYEGWAGPGRSTRPQFSEPGLSDSDSIYIYKMKSPHALPIEITENHRLPEDCYGERPRGAGFWPSSCITSRL